jgi:hypothetical protein
VIVIVAGMQRSGSTFSYNVVRELLNHRGGTLTYASNSLDDLLSDSSEVDNAIVKSHSPDKFINALLAKKGIPCVCTVRKPEDAIASWSQVFGFTLEESVETFANWLAWHQRMHVNMLNVSYEEIDRYPLLAINKISKYLLSKRTYLENLRIWQNNKKKKVYEESMRLSKDQSVDIGFSFYDKVNFYHRRHVSSVKSRSAEELLSKDQLEFIRAGLSRYVDASGVYRWE